MILEKAISKIKSGETDAFEKAFAEAQSIISSMKGYIKHELLRCIEEKDTYLLLVQWETLAAHEIGFRKSPEYQEWKRLLHHFYDPFPKVQHFESVLISLS